jgi:hypothetical protein
MRLWSFTQAPFRLTQKVLLQTGRQVTKKSGAAHMKFILSVTACQAMSLMIGSGLNVSSKRSLFSNEAGIVFSSSATPTPRTEIDIQRTETVEGETNDDARTYLIENTGK